MKLERKMVHQNLKVFICDTTVAFNLYFNVTFIPEFVI